MCDPFRRSRTAVTLLLRCRWSRPRSGLEVAQPAMRRSLCRESGIDDDRRRRAKRPVVGWRAQSAANEQDETAVDHSVAPTPAAWEVSQGSTPCCDARPILRRPSRGRQKVRHLHHLVRRSGEHTPTSTTPISRSTTGAAVGGGDVKAGQFAAREGAPEHPSVEALSGQIGGSADILSVS